MRAFLLAVAACIVIGVGAAFILNSLDPDIIDRRTAESARPD